MLPGILISYPSIDWSALVLITMNQDFLQNGLADFVYFIATQRLLYVFLTMPIFELI